MRIFPFSPFFEVCFVGAIRHGRKLMDVFGRANVYLPCVEMFFPSFSIFMENSDSENRKKSTFTLHRSPCAWYYGKSKISKIFIIWATELSVVSKEAEFHIEHFAEKKSKIGSFLSDLYEILFLGRLSFLSKMRRKSKNVNHTNFKFSTFKQEK